MDWFSGLVPPPETREPFTWYSASTVVLPSLVLYYLTAYLVLTPGSLPVRLALLPISLSSFFYTATRVDLVHGFKRREELVYINKSLVLAMTVAAGRCITWSYQQIPYKRLYRIPGETSPLKENKDHRLLDAFDLTTNLRGHGWSWSHGLRLPLETRPTHSRSAFLLATLADFIKYAVLGDHLHWAIQWLGPTIGSPVGGSIYYPSLPPIENFLRSTLLSFLTGALVYFAVQSAYHLFTLVGVGMLNQHPLQWPPVFDSPWMSTSLSEFWANRWHQIFRDMFISVGGKPLSLFFGRGSGVMGAFFVSGMLHDFGTWGLGRGAEFSSVGGFFLLQGFGVILEHTWKQVTGSRVGGELGRIWAYAWIIIWGRWIVDAWCRKGLGASIFYLDCFRPSYITLGKLPLLST